VQLTFLHGYPDRVGKRATFVGFGNGPKSYATAGDPITLPIFQFYIDAMFGNGVLTVSKTYFVRAFPAGSGPRQAWSLKWYTASTGSEVSAATDLSAEVIQIGGLGGFY
jgi:hypothetical protein